MLFQRQISFSWLYQKFYPFKIGVSLLVRTSSTIQFQCNSNYQTQIQSHLHLKIHFVRQLVCPRISSRVKGSIFMTTRFTFLVLEFLSCCTAQRIKLQNISQLAVVVVLIQALFSEDVLEDKEVLSILNFQLFLVIISQKVAFRSRQFRFVQNFHFLSKLHGSLFNFSNFNRLINYLSG